jgi:YwiC-like protein
MSVAVRTGAAAPRSVVRAVAVPDEHGGWGLTLEPVLLGLLVAPSWPGLALALAAFSAFLVRTPLRVVLVDRWRRRSLPRTRVAATVATVELVLLAALAVVVTAAAGPTWLVPVALAVPLVAVELWFDMRSRSRRLVPELAGAVGMAATAAAIVLAAGEGADLAAASWLLLAGRSVAAIPFVRVELDRWRHGTAPVVVSDLACVVGVAVAVAAVLVDDRLVPGAVAVAALSALQAAVVRRPPVPAKVLGVGELVAGLVVVVAAAGGVAAA